MHLILTFKLRAEQNVKIQRQHCVVFVSFASRHTPNVQDFSDHYISPQKRLLKLMLIPACFKRKLDLKLMVSQDHFNKAAMKCFLLFYFVTQMLRHLILLALNDICSIRTMAVNK